MPRCLMAKKWKAYPWPDREGDPQDGDQPAEEDDEEIDVVGDAGPGWAPGGAVPTPNNWGPSSPTAGATAPSPPPSQSGSSMDSTSRVAVLYNDHVQDPIHYAAFLPQSYHEDASRRAYTSLQTDVELVTSVPPTPHNPQWTEKRYQVLSSLENKSELLQDGSGHRIILITPSHDLVPEKPTAYPPLVNNEPAESLPETHSKETTPNKISKKSMAMCFTSTGAALSLPPKKKDIYRPYSLDDRPTVVKPKPRPLVTATEKDAQPPEPTILITRSYEPESVGLTIGRMVEVRDSQVEQDTVNAEHEEYCRKAAAMTEYSHDTESPPRDQESYYEERYREGDVSYQREVEYREDQSYTYEDRSYERYRPAEDISAAHAILDLSASTSILPASVQETSPGLASAQSSERVFKVTTPTNKTVAYTYEAFFVSDGRSKKKPAGPIVAEIPPPEATDSKAKYTCTECGKQYATSSNLSRHKQTHRSLDSQSAKKCMTCGKAYVSMPALAMHLLTHKLSHGCGVCGKLFSRPWLLQGHLRSHTGEKPYGCAHCGKAFADRSNLRAHMQTHSIDKNYICMRCNKSFALKSYLNKHLESACFKDASMKDGSGASGMDVSPLTPPQSPSPILSYSL